ncbi:MAG: basic amino acid/polyamine antiporter, family, partial [Thermoleophilaceae bacterium]|nr:basic amino acid/polyamine antiporter, family [Thermoleophilaceae bacterium]
MSREGRAGRGARGSADHARARAADRARSQLRRGSERARRADARIARGLGEPALFAILLSAVVSGLFMVLGVVAGDALGLTPVAFLIAGLFFVFAIATYVEGSSLHPERGGASTFARYAFDELWSFVAGWAILLDYLIVMAIGAVTISDYLAVFWTDLDQGVIEVVIAGLALLYVAAQNVRGLGADRLGMVLRLSLLGILLLLTVSVIALVQNWDPAAITDSVHLGSAPGWDELLFATVVAGVALVGVEAASGLAGEVRVGRRGLRRVVGLTSITALVLFVCVSTAALMAVPVVGG